MKKKPLSLLLLTAATALVSCGGHKSEFHERYLTTEDPSSEVEIVFWHCLGKSKTDNFQIAVDNFNSKYAGKYKVVPQHVSGEYKSLHEDVKKKLASGEVPALTMGYPDSFAEYITNDINDTAIIKLDNFINDPNYGYSQTELEDFVEGYYNEGTGYQFEGTWSLPMYKSTEVMYYNKSLFMGYNEQNIHKFAGNKTFEELAEAVKEDGSSSTEYNPNLKTDLEALETFCKNNGGYTYEVPTTWEDMMDLGRQMLRDRAAEGITAEFYPVGYDSDANLLISQMAQLNIPYTDAKASGAGHFLFNNQQAKDLVADILQNINDKLLVTKGVLPANNYTNEYFTADKIAMSIGSTGGSTYQISNNFEVGIAPVPYRKNGTKKYIQQGPSICFFDNDDDFIHKGAWLFYKEIADTTNNAVLALENSYDPIRWSSYETEEYETWIGGAGKGVLKYDVPKLTSTLKEYYISSGTFVGSSVARNEMDAIFTNIKSKGYSIDNAFQSAMNACTAAA